MASSFQIDIPADAYPQAPIDKALIQRLLQQQPRQLCPECGKDMLWGDPYRASHPGGFWLDAPHNRWYCPGCDELRYRTNAAIAARRARQAHVARMVRVIGLGALVAGALVLGWFALHSNP
jgi:hypothetical protein